VAEQERVGFGRGHQAAADRQHHRLAAAEQVGQRFFLEPAIEVLTVNGEHIVQRHAGAVLDLLIELDEAQAEPPREPAADGRLARAAQAEQRDDAWGRVATVMADEVGGRGLQRRR